jgi:hypothetical protein
VPPIEWGNGVYRKAICWACGQERAMHRILAMGDMRICLKCVRKIVRAYLDRYLP